MSIRVRLALLFGAAALLLLVGGGVLFVTNLERGLDQSLTLTLETHADNLSSQLVSFSGEPVAHDRIRWGEGSFGQLLSPTGQLITGSRLLAAVPLLSPAQTRLAEHKTVVLDRSVALAPTADRPAEAMRLLARRIRPSKDVLVVALSREVVDEAVSRARTQLVVLGVAVLLLAGPGAWLLTGAALRPVERMRREVGDIQARNEVTRLRVPRTGDEIARLAETFNVVLARMHAAVAHEQALVADAGHELRTPLTVLKGELELARRPQRTREELLTTVEVAADETERLVRLTEDLLFLSRTEVDDRQGLLAQPFDLRMVAGRSAEALSGMAARRCVRIDVEASGPLPCVGNPEWIRRAIDNVLANALRYAPAGSAVTIRISHEDGEARLSVADAGPGLPPEFLPFAFDRFSRADDSRSRTGPVAAETGGSGLGLAIVRSIITRHGGTATVANRPGGGAEVTLRWPAP